MNETKNKNIFTSGLVAVSEINESFFITIKILLLKPEVVIKSSLTDKNEYANPFKFAFIIISFFVFITTLFDFDLMSVINESEPELMKKENLISVIDFIHNATAFLVFIAIMPAAWIGKKLFASHNKTFSEFYIINLYLSTEAILLQLLIIIPLSIFTDIAKETISNWSSLPLIIYSYWVLKRLFNESIFATAWKSIVNTIVSALAQVLLVFLIIFSVGVYTGITEAYELETKKTAAINQETD